MTYHAFLNNIQVVVLVQQRKTQRKPNFPASFLFLVIIQSQYNTRNQLPNTKYTRKENFPNLKQEGEKQRDELKLMGKQQNSKLIRKFMLSIVKICVNCNNRRRRTIRIIQIKAYCTPQFCHQK